MKKATLRGLFAPGPTFNKNIYKNKWQWLTPGMVWTGVAQPCPHSSVTSAPCLCFVIHGEVPWHRSTREVSAVWGSRQSRVAISGLWAGSLGSCTTLEPQMWKVRVAKSILSFPSCWEPQNHGVSCIGGAQNNRKAYLKACAIAAQDLHTPKNAALAGQESMHEHPYPPEPAWPPEPWGTTWVPPSAAASITKARICGMSLFSLFPFFPSITLC